MIDIEREIYTPIARAVRDAFPDADVAGAYTKTPSSFPHVSIVEADNYTTPSHLDSSDTEQYATLMYEVNVYSNKTPGKKEECRSILSLIDKMFYRFNFTRLSMVPVPNVENATIHRITARYQAETDGTYTYRV